MCGVVGILAQTRVNQMLYDALTIVQHRGQDAAGIMTCDQQRMYLRKSNGLVRDAIREKHMLALKGNMGIGHVRYPTAGTDSVTEAQPFYVNSPYGLGVVHNGNLTNTQALTKELSETDHRHLNTCSDSEVMLNVLAYELQQTTQSHFNPQQLLLAMRMVYARLEGAFASVAMINGHGLLAFRDAQGIRPLVYGQR
ncbi:MAG TPA: amidophosphoribosyltransferase, partial [Coxiellaceae bacterium]|nr:amidophosphoribosyltransferase [Coxiellaceae bacterium]